MARIVLTGTPVDLVVSHGLDPDTTYTAQARLPAGDKSSVVHFDDSETSPDNTEIGIVLGHRGILRIKAGEEGHLWAWASSGRGTLDIYEAV